MIESRGRSSLREEDTERKTWQNIGSEKNPPYCSYEAGG